MRLRIILILRLLFSTLITSSLNVLSSPLQFYQNVFLNQNQQDVERIGFYVLVVLVFSKNYCSVANSSITFAVYATLTYL